MKLSKSASTFYLFLFSFLPGFLTQESGDDAYSGLTWFIQISDVHISYKHPNRTQQFREFVTGHLPVIKPDLVLCTGDLTDGKTNRGLSSHQVEEEWRSYYEVVSSRRPGTPWLDIRGNHDNLNVLSRQSNQNLFRNFSSMGREGNLESYKYSTRLRGRNYNFVALDATLDVGMRFPFNFIGDFSDTQQEKIRSLVDTLDKSEPTIFFGHYPSSTVRQKQFLLDTVDKGLAYLCGHLHDLQFFRVQDMYSLHAAQTMELELVDWKWNRAYRLLALDQGFLSFTDLRFGQWPVILVTLPKKSEFLLESKEPDFEMRWNYIRILIFSPDPVVSAVVEISEDAKIVCTKQGSGPLFTCPWDPVKYRSGLHTLKATAVDSKGRTGSVTQQFTLDKKAAVPFYRSFSSFILGISFSTVFQVLYVVSAILGSSYLPLLRTLSSPATQRRLPAKLLPLIQCSLQICCFRKSLNVASVKPLFYFFTLFPVYLAVGPWVVGSMIEDAKGAAFAWGTVVSNQYVPTEVGYFKYALQILLIHPVVLLTCGHILECRAYSSGQSSNKCSKLMHVVVVILLLAVAYIFIFESLIFWLQFGVLGVIFGVLNTWSLLLYSLSIYWSIRVNKSAVYTNIIIEDHGKKTDDEQEPDL